MMSRTSHIVTRDIAAAGLVNASDNGAVTPFVPKERKNEPASEIPDLPALMEEVHQKINTIHNADLEFSVHEGSGEVVVKVVDATTGKVIREIPPTEMLDLAARLDEMIGLLFDQIG